MPSDLPSSRQLLSNDDLQEDKKEELFRTVVCCVVYNSCTQQ